jgi:hypothetical protein
MPTEAPGIIVAEVAPCDDTADISVAARALIDLQVAVPVVDRLCDAMIAATSDRGAVPGTLVLQLAVDGGVTGLVALQLRERLGISASVPVPRRVAPLAPPAADETVRVYLCVNFAAAVAAAVCRCRIRQCCR